MTNPALGNHETVATVSGHIERAGVFDLPVPPDRALRYFSPEGERRWVPNWSPEYLHPLDGRLGPGTVFRTEADGEHTVWLVLGYSADLLEARYVRVTPGSRIGLVTVRCAPGPADTTRVTASYEMTALSPAGIQALERVSAAAFAAMLDQWQTRITAAIRTGG